MKPGTTPAQIAANRANSSASTGPRTPEGKEASRYNRLRHGFSSALTVLPFENQEEYNSLHASLSEALSPEGPVEEALVAKIASAQWKLRRLEKIEENTLMAMVEASKSDANSDPYAAISASLIDSGKHQQALNSIVRYQSTLNRQFSQAVRELRHFQNIRRSQADREERLNILHEIVGITERSQNEVKALDILASDPGVVNRYLEAETSILARQIPREILLPRPTISTDLER